MGLPEELKKSAVFLCCKDIDSCRPEGTAFLLGMPTTDPNVNAFYLVTAKHVIDDIPKRGTADSFIYARINPIEGRTAIDPIKSSPDDWLTHPTDQSDIAVIPFRAPLAHDYDVVALSTSIALTHEAIEKEQIGVGDDVFTIGLFVKHTGRLRDVPIVRTGNIAMMHEDIGDMEAFLVEARSIGGLSGSPVFVRANPFLGNSLNIKPQPFFWLGIHHGAWHTSRTVDAASDEFAGMHMGIGIVIPAWKVMEVLNQPALARQREELVREHRDSNRPVPD